MVRLARALPAVLAALLGTSASTVVPAADLLEVRVAPSGEARYVAEFQVRIDTPPELVHRRLTDYGRLHRLSPAIREARVLGAPRPGVVRVYTRTRDCVLFLCWTVVNVQDVTEPRPGRIRAHTVPELSDFAFGRAEWDLRADGAGTLVRHRAEFTPKFWLPPGLAAWWLRQRLSAEAVQTARRIEESAIAADRQ